MNKKAKKSDGRLKNGGYRPNAGRKEGVLLTPVSKNVVVRLPVMLLQEFKDKKVKNKTQLIISAVKKELKKIPYPEGFTPLSEEEVIAKIVKPGISGRPNKS